MKKERNFLWAGILLLAMFALWTVLVQTVDVRSAGESGTDVGFATVNIWFHERTGVHLWLYTVTDWLGLVPVFVCMAFGALGLTQLIARRSFMKVDLDILLLGVEYVLAIFGYLLFEELVINYRPILIEGRMEASYPSSTVLLVLGVMPAAVFQVRRRVQQRKVRWVLESTAVLFSLLMVVARLISGVHWLTDIIGSVFLSMGMFLIYVAAVLRCDRKNADGGS